MSDIVIDADQLRQDLAAQKENVDSWARNVLQSAKGVSAQHEHSRRRHTGTLGMLQLQLALLRCRTRGCVS